MKKVGIVSLGCSKNLVDSEMILGLLQDDGYIITPKVNEADYIIINTCGFIESSKKEAIDTIFEFLKTDAKVVVTGCLVNRYQKELEKGIPEVSKFIPISSYEDFNQLFPHEENINFSSKGLSFYSRVLCTPFFTSYLRISDGCNNNCSYCAIPLIRGSNKSRTMDDILFEASLLEKKGVKEVVVLAQDTTKYGQDLKDGSNIEDLLGKLLEKTSFEYIRLLYLYPDEISDRLIEMIGSNKRLTPYFDIPIQHSETKILKAMNRRGDKDLLKGLFKKIREKVPKAILRTTIMVGFPGEDESDFSALLDFINEVKFDHLGAFMYSKEEGTASYNFKNQVSKRTKKERLDKLMRLQQDISKENNKKHLGEIMEGLVVGFKKGFYLLRSYFNAPDDVDGNIYFTSPIPLNIADKVKIKISETSIYDLFGLFISKCERE